MKFNIHAEMIPQVPIEITIKADNKVLGYALVTVDIEEEKTALDKIGFIGQKPKPKSKKTATLWHIYVARNERRKGNAARIIDFLKKENDVIITGATTREGTFMLKSQGFERILNVWKWEKK